MIATKKMPVQFQKWNKKWKAPNGIASPLGRMFPRKFRPLVNGFFCIQRNNSIRQFEYPWAFNISGISKGMAVIDIGGGLGGFQFVLDKCGCNVTNIDPGPSQTQSKWLCNKTTMKHLNNLFHTKVNLMNVTLNEAILPPESYDRAFSISVMEHFNENDIQTGMNRVFDALKPDGLFILTVDLFLDIYPFTKKQTNIHGKNMDIRSMIEDSKFTLVEGNPSQLYGYTKFNTDSILSSLAELLYGSAYPALSQCFVLKKKVT